MAKRHPVEQILLWIFIVLAAIVIGGGLYEMRVVVPLWANSPPESVWNFASQRVTNPQYTPNSGLRFWIFVTPAHLLISFATLIAALKTGKQHRRWLIVSTAIFVLLHLSALFYFVPAIDRLFNSRNLNMNPEEVASKARWWVNLTWGRFVIGFVGFLCGLRAMTISSEQRAVSG
ncbi:MAG TPA: hypothetical protein VIF81_06375 [Pyrinomonadaceae bacterium]|jgi:hypothetical protein